MKTMLSFTNMLQRFFIIIGLLLGTLAVNAQTFPVQVTPQLLPPFTVKLSDYTTTASEKLAVNILLTDVNEIGRRIRLKMYVEGQGLSISTQDMVVGAPPIFVDGGINLRLTNIDLQAYFRLNNLRGITAQQYNNPLPNGAYNYCFEVYDYFSGLQLSSKSCTTAFLVQNDPPILNLPTRNNVVNAINPQNVLFTWSPRHTNISNIQYEFTLKEIWDQQNPQASFLASVPFYRVVTRNTTLLVGPEAPQLLSGKIYGWQVRAFLSDGISETSVFKNDGKSEIFWFKYIEDCKPPSFLLSQALSTESVRVNWQTSEHLKYKIQYRKKGFGEEDWFEVNSYTNEGNIYNLESDTVYEFRVGGECTPLSGYAYSNIQEFTTPKVDEEAYYNCGLMPEINIKNQEPLPSLEINDTFTAGDFPVVVRKVEGSNGSFSGWGYITIPFLEKIKTLIDLADQAFGPDENGEGGINIGKYTRIKVQFNNININTGYQLTGGVVQTSYDANWGSLLDVDEVIDDIVGNDGKVQGFDASNIDINTVTVDENGNVIITPEEGDPFKIEVPLPTVITDSQGQQWTISEDGTVTESVIADGGVPTKNNTEGISGGSTGNSVRQISSKDVKVEFIPSGNYSTDAYNKVITSNKYKREYEFIETQDKEEYEVLYKLISDTPDIIKAKVTLANGKKKEDIIFKTLQGSEVTSSWSSDNEVVLNLTKKFNFGKEEIIAAVKPKDSTQKYTIAGKLNVWHAQQRNINITLVSVDGASTAGVSDRINEIYNKAGVKFTVSEDNLDINLKTLDVGDSDLLSHYTEGEKAIINAYKGKGTKKDQYYIFFLNDGVTLSKKIEGFMPLKRQFGFVFNTNDPGRIAAHEIGHGIFGLKHPYDQYNAKNSKGNTDYLMDTGSGTAFSHMDWQKLHAPGIQLYLFQGDEDGENISSSISKLLGLENEGGNSYTFISPSGELVMLKKEGLKSVFFKDGLKTDLSQFDVVQGTLLGFVIENDGIDLTYEYSFINDNYSTIDEKYIIPEDIEEATSSAIMLYSCSDGFYLTKFEAKGIKVLDEQVNSTKNVVDFPIKIKTEGSEYYSNSQRSILDVNFSEMNPTPSGDKYAIAVDPDFFTELESRIITDLGNEFGECNNYGNFALLRFVSLAAFYSPLYSQYSTELSSFELGEKYEDIYPVYIDAKTNSNFNILLFYKKLGDSFKKYVENRKEEQGSLLDNLSIDTSTADLLSIMQSFNLEDYNTLSYEKRILLIRGVVKHIKGSANSATEDNIIDYWNDNVINQVETSLQLLVTSMPNEDHRKFLVDIKKGKTDFPEVKTPSLLFSLLYALDGNNYVKFSTSVTVWLMENKDLLKRTSSLAEKIDNNDLLKFSPGFFNNYANIEWLRSDGKIVLGNYPIWYTTKGQSVADETKNFSYDPYEIVNVFIHDDYNHLNQMSFIEGTSVQLPAITLFMLFNEASKQAAKQGAFFVLDVAFFAIGVGEIKAALTILNSTHKLIRTSIAVTDMVVGIGDASINRIWFNEINNSGPKGQAFIKEWNSFMLYYCFSRISSEVLNVGAAKLYNHLSKNKAVLNLTDDQVRIFQNEIKLRSGLDPNSDELISQYTSKAIFSDDAIILGDDLAAANITSWINKNDEFVDVVIHYNNKDDLFEILIEGTTYKLSSIDVAKKLIDVEISKTIRLLSCNGKESAIEISQTLQRDIMSSTGDTKLYSNGTVEAKNWYIAKPDGTSIDFTPNSVGALTDEFVLLGRSSTQASDDILLEGYTWSKVNNSGATTPPTEIKLNLGGEGELLGYIDLNPMLGNKLSKSQSMAKNPTGGFIEKGAEDIPFANNSVDEIKGLALPGPVLNAYGPKIAEEIKRVLKPGSKAKLTSNTAAFSKFEEFGFKVNGNIATYTKVASSGDDLLSNLKRKIGDILDDTQWQRLETDIPLLTKLSDDLNLNSDLELFLKADSNNLSVWENVKYFSDHTYDVNFLTWNKTFQDWTTGNGKKLYEHLFKGKTGGTNGVSGVHHIDALTNKTGGFSIGDIRIKSGTKVSKGNGFYEAEIEFWDGTNWIIKKENGIPVKNGFFPDDWTHSQIMEEVAFARSKVSVDDWVAVPGKERSNAYIKPLSNGQNIMFYIGQATEGIPPAVGNYTISVFPVY